MLSRKNALTGAASIATLATVGLWGASGIAQNLQAGPFTQGQADAGRNIYAASCMACHGDTLSGSGEAPPLAGRGFMVAWGGKSTKDLYDTIHEVMPADAPGSLTPVAYTNLVAFLLHANGAKSGAAALMPTSAVKVSSVANGTIAPDVTAGVKPVQMAQAAAPAAAALAAAPAARAAAAGGDDRPAGMRGENAGRIWQSDQSYGVVKPGTVPNFKPVTDEMLINPSPNDWLMYRGNYSGWSYSGLGQINAGNVGQLQLKWTLAMTDGGTQETTPLVHDGIFYVESAGNVVQAVNAVTGDVIWQNNIGPWPKSREPGASGTATRSIAIYNDKIIVPTIQGKLYGLDAKTGKIAWQTWISDPAKPDEGQRGNTGGVIVAKGKAIVGLTGCGRLPQKAHCYISAYDANTGARLWKFYTIANHDEPNGDTWGGLPDDQRVGADTWIAGTYDPALNTTYWGIAQAKPWRRDLRGSGTGATDYANSTVALDVDTGKLKWFFNHAPGESFDLDEVFERILIDHGQQKTVMTTGKTGILWKLDRVTGKYLDSRQTVFQNVYTKIDPKTGTPTYRKDLIDQKPDQWLPTCPGPEGGKDWMAASYHQPDDTMIIPLSQTCVTFSSSGAQKFYEMPGADGNMGRLSAYQTSNLKPVWSLQQRAPFMTGVMSTAGNVAFVGDFDRYLHAFDTKTGHQLWKTRLGTTVQGHIITYAVDGKQYLAVMTGLGGGSPEMKPDFFLSEETWRPANGQAVYVFGLPDSNQQASNK